MILPDGDLQVAVVDIMGKGVSATKDALTVTHALRLLALEGCALSELVAKADPIVTAQSPDLVATLMVGRYIPATGAVAARSAPGTRPRCSFAAARSRSWSAGGIPFGLAGRRVVRGRRDHCSSGATR